MSGRWYLGARVSELAISKELGVSRGPVREAVALLAAEGMLHLAPGIGAMVPTNTRSEIEQMFLIRLQLEPLVVAAAAKNSSPRGMRRLRRNLRQMAQVARLLTQTVNPDEHNHLFAQFVDADAAFHANLVKMAGWDMVAKVILGQQSLSISQSHVAVPPPVSIIPTFAAGVIREHRAIYKAIEARDSDTAAEAITDSLKQGLELALRNYERRANQREETMARTGAFGGDGESLYHAFSP